MTNKPITPDEAQALLDAAADMLSPCKSCEGDNYFRSSCTTCNGSGKNQVDAFRYLNANARLIAQAYIQLSKDHKAQVEKLKQERNNAAKNVRNQLLPKMSKLQKENKELTERIKDMEDQLTVAYMSGVADGRKQSEAQIDELCSAILSVNRSRNQMLMVEGDDEPVFWQRKEWIEWICELAEETIKSNKEHGDG